MDPSASHYLSTWHSINGYSQHAANYAFPVVQQAFQEGLDRFASDLTKDAKKVTFSKGFASMRDIKALVDDAFAKYSDEKRFHRTRKWLQRITSKVHHYGNIMDVLVQHHPEYVALAWGAMKLLLVSAQNHEATICLISKALSQIAESLPRIELATVLYPTERMRKAVGNLYAHLIRFFIRAYEWCQEGSLRRLLDSITRPSELRYRDLLEDITENSRQVDQLATSSARVELREIHLQLRDFIAKSEASQALHSSTLSSFIAKWESSQALHSSALLDTNQRLSDLQFSQIMSHISEGKFGDPLQALRFNQSLQMRQDRSQVFETTNNFWQSPKLQTWSTAAESRVAIVRGGYNARFVSRKFSINLIQQLQSKNIPVFWALRGPQSNSDDAKASSTDLFKHLILQAMKLSKDSATESTMSLQCAQFHRAMVEQDWLQLLGSALLRASSQVYLVIDLSTLDQSLLPMQGFSWFSAFQDLFADMMKRSPQLQVKVLLLGNNNNYATLESEHIPCDAVIPIKVTRTPVRMRKRMGPRGQGYQHRGCHR